ncbi:NADPH-dependent FMN reductase [Schumannella luteola]
MKLMIIVGSVRPGRAGLPIAQWVRQRASSEGRFDVDFVDLAELDLPFMDEPAHPAKRQYTKPHTIAWSERVDAADAFILVSPEYNHSYSPVLKNALDYLSQEWRHKPVSIVSYGGVSAGSRGVAALEPVLTTIGLVKAGANVEINFVGQHVQDGVFHPEQKHDSILHTVFNQLHDLSGALTSLRTPV